ncbi:protein kinase domain-containing protein [Streptomyces californicus]|uniref:protein kinase domain-containing protein n=1 Tax=Streptomyces californicus TaxID=67351 RepID=UPI0033C4C542
MACAVGLGVARAFAAAHEAGVLHRDVKPTNVGITRQDSVVLHDFGPARLAGESAITRTGVTMGTPQFMAPEVIMGAAPGPTADLYGLGVCLHFMLTGDLPFGPAAEVGAVVDSALGAGIRPLSTGLFPFTPVNLALLVDRLCAREASARPRTAAEAVLEWRAGRRRAPALVVRRGRVDVRIPADGAVDAEELRRIVAALGEDDGRTREPEGDDGTA